MRITRIAIENFKSLKSIDITLPRLCLLVGPNGAGKSNFLSALGFLAAVHRDGLEYAIAQHGGYENIAHRKLRRTKAPVSFDVTIELDASERLADSPSYRSYSSASTFFTSQLKKQRAEGSAIKIRHRFAISAPQRIDADFRVDSEQLAVTTKSSDGISDFIFELSMDERGLQTAAVGSDHAEESLLDQWIETINKNWKRRRAIRNAREGDSIDLPSRILQPLLPHLVQASLRSLSRVAVHRLSPTSLRRLSAPIPNPTLSETGDNIAAYAHWLRKRRKAQWRTIRRAMLQVLPTIEDISTRALHSKTIGLFVKEEGVGRDWTADEVSDGTIQTLGLLLAIYGSQRRALVALEEIENSIHPWVIQDFVRRLRDSSDATGCLITSHSPTVIDCFSPSELVVAQRTDGETTLRSLVELDPTVPELFEGGDALLSDYLTSGLLPTP